MKIGIVIGSTRQNRVTERLALWVERAAKQQAPTHEWRVIDIQQFDLPLMREPLPPMAGQRPELSEGTKKYLAAMGEVDGFIIVTPEYNHSVPGALKNAIDTLDYQLMKKPVAIVSHGVVGGARANEQLRLIVNSNLGAVPVPASLTFYGKVAELIDEQGVRASGHDANEKALTGVIENLVWYAAALKTARET